MKKVDFSGQLHSSASVSTRQSSKSLITLGSSSINCYQNKCRSGESITVEVIGGKGSESYQTIDVRLQRLRLKKITFTFSAKTTVFLHPLTLDLG